MKTELDEEPHESHQGVKVIRIHLDTSYNNLPNSSMQLGSPGGPIKAKYYKQTYRTAWESMPDFKGWLCGVQGEPTRAYCLYCQKTLHAHRLSLLKHTCTIRHQKAAQIHNIRKSKNQMANSEEGALESSSLENDGEIQGEDAEALVEYTEVEDGDPEDEELEHEEMEDEEEEGIQLENLPVQLQKTFQQEVVNPSLSTKPPISTHVLDSSKGIAVSGLQVSLYKLIDGRWTYINEGLTNADGRFAKFLERSDFTPGRYKLHYDVDRYFEAKKMESMYPFIEIVFDCRSPNDHYHIPLLLSAYGYTTYRGT